jgi:hypothetical protein
MIKDFEKRCELLIRRAVKQAVDATIMALGPDGIEVVDAHYDATLGVITITFQKDKETNAEQR